MKHNYLIESTDFIAITSKINNILNDIKDKEVVKFDLDIDSFDKVLENINTYSFLSSSKVVICHNVFFLGPGEYPEFKKLKKYLESPSDNYLILVTDNLSDRKEIKDILKYFDVIDGRISSEVLIKRNLGNYIMDNSTVKYFASYCLGNNNKILNELNKLKCYKYNDNNIITREDIDNIVMKDYNENIFDIVNAIVKRDKSLAFDILSRIMQKEKDTTVVVASIASQIRLLYSVKILKEDNLKDTEIANILGVKPMAVSIASQNAYNFSTKKLLYLIRELAVIDLRTKSENVNAVSLLNRFILEI